MKRVKSQSTLNSSYFKKMPTGGVSTRRDSQVENSDKQAVMPPPSNQGCEKKPDDLAAIRSDLASIKTTIENNSQIMKTTVKSNDLKDLVVEIVKDIVKELLEKSEEKTEKMVQTVVENRCKEIELDNRKIRRELKDEMDVLNLDIHTLREKMDESNETIRNIRSKSNKVENDSKEALIRSNKNELYSRKTNIKVCGVKEENENPLEEVQNALKEKPGMDIGKDEVLAEHRIPIKHRDQAQPIPLKGSDDIIFETFYHRSGKEIQCMYLNHMRFYLDDWGSKEWQPFPKRWYNEGLLITNSVVKDAKSDQRRRQDQSGAPGSNIQRRHQQTSSGQDDREGYIQHPNRGKVPTYIFQRKHNVHCFYDHDQGQWMRMPISWEMHHEMVGQLVDQVEESLPNWGDRHDILALLRACNYDPDECITTYLTLEGDPWLKTARNSKEADAADQKEDTIERLQLKEMEEALKQERAAKQEAEKIVKEQTERLSELEAENHQINAQLMALQNARPKTARPKTPQVVIQVVKEPTIDPEDFDMLNNTAKELRKCQAQLKMQCQRHFDSIKDMMAKEMEEVCALFRKEAMQRKLLFNQMQELSGNIRVFCRVRKDDRGQCCMKFLSDSDLMVIDQNQGKKMFSFDRVFDMKSTQEMIFEETKSIITSCLDGYNVCLIAYGQTGSGKTFTMMGPENNPGINIRAMKELFEVCKERVETITYTMRVSLIEIYNETIQDLLTSDAKTLELRTAGNKVNIPGLTDVEIKNIDDIKRTVKTGDKNRTTAGTKMNSSSSRSHLLLMLAVEGHDKVTGAISKGTLTLCDLAGSERISKTEAERQRLVEAAAINKSLSALGQVFTWLRTSQLHVPYRNSKLTQILQPSLSGDAKVCLFVNCSPGISNYSETVSTLTFGSNAKQVALGQAKQNIKKGPQ